MAFVLLSRSSSKPQSSVRPGPKRKPARGQRPTDSQFEFAKPVVQPPTAAVTTAPVIQTKLKVGEPYNKFEQEADRVADKVMKMPEALLPGAAISTSASAYPSSAIQPHCSECARSGGLCPQCVEKEKFESNTLEETIQPKKDTGPAPDVGPDVKSRIGALRGCGQPLPQSLRAFFEPRFGYDFSHVLIHSDDRAAESARNLQAKAFTIGHDIVFGKGQYALEKPEGRHLLAHELTHVVQQTEKSHFYGGESHLGLQRKPENECPRLISFTASGKDPSLSDKCKGECRFELGCCPTERGKCGSGDTSGMIFKAVVRAEKNCKGELAFMQNLLSTNRKITKSDGTEECKKADKPHRDGMIPWKGCNVSVDGPGEFTIISDDCPNRELTDNPAGVSITDLFKTFVLWKPEGAKERHSLASVTWGWSGAITRAKGKECASQYKIVSASHTDGKGKASEEKPITTPEVKDIKPGPCK